MKEIFKIIKEHFILLFGVGLFIYGLFNFRHFHRRGIYTDEVIATFYYYNYISLILLTIGAIFIVIGLLKIRKNKD